MAPRVAAAQPPLATIRQRLESAEAELLKQSVASPYVAGARNISREDAEHASSPLAREAWSAANKVAGTKIETLVQGRYVDALLPRGVATPDDVTNLKNRALSVLATLAPAGATELPPGALDELPRKVDAYWSSTFGPQKLLPEQRDALVQLIRDACE